MARIPGTTNAQTRFLRAFRTSPTGPAPADWPAPAILRRWLRHDRFRMALRSVREALRFQADLHLATAASNAARDLAAPTIDSDAAAASTAARHQSLRVLSISHIRERFAPDDSAVSEEEYEKFVHDAARARGYTHPADPKKR